MTLTKIKSIILGSAIGDALGVPVEFRFREELAQNPVTDMHGYGTYNLPAGCWSDDTSMTLAALDSLAEGELDWAGIMFNFGKWYYDDEYTPTGWMFDVGGTCRQAIDNYFIHHKSAEECGLTDEYSNGNGSLMRIAPFVLFTEYAAYLGNWLDIIRKGSALTHAHECSMLGCCIYAVILRKLLHTPDKSAITEGLREAADLFGDNPEIKHYRRLFDLNFAALPQKEIRSSGYVVDTLEVAVWCLLTTDSYAECVLKAVNLGEDTDTTAAVAGGLAGALYGMEGIPAKWLEKLKRREYIEEMCVRAAVVWRTADSNINSRKSEA